MTILTRACCFNVCMTVGSMPMVSFMIRTFGQGSATDVKVRASSLPGWVVVEPATYPLMRARAQSTSGFLDNCNKRLHRKVRFNNVAL